MSKNKAKSQTKKVESTKTTRMDSKEMKKTQLFKIENLTAFLNSHFKNSLTEKEIYLLILLILNADKDNLVNDINQKELAKQANTQEVYVSILMKNFEEKGLVKSYRTRSRVNTYDIAGLVNVIAKEKDNSA